MSAASDQQAWTHRQQRDDDPWIATAVYSGNDCNPVVSRNNAITALLGQLNRYGDGDHRECLYDLSLWHGRSGMPWSLQMKPIMRISQFAPGNQTLHTVVSRYLDFYLSIQPGNASFPIHLVLSPLER